MIGKRLHNIDIYPSYRNSCVSKSLCLPYKTGKFWRSEIKVICVSHQAAFCQNQNPSMSSQLWKNTIFLKMLLVIHVHSSTEPVIKNSQGCRIKINKSIKWKYRTKEFSSYIFYIYQLNFFSLFTLSFLPKKGKEIFCGKKRNHLWENSSNHCTIK